MSDWSVSPDPPVKGQQCTVCFLGDVPTTVEITTNPGGTSQHPVTAEERCFTVTVPANAITFIAHDTDSGSDDYTSPVVPP